MGFTGIGVGAALLGLKPIVQFMTINFSLQAIDHIVNSAAKLRYMSSGILETSIVFRGLNGPAAAVAAQHSQCFAAWYGSLPGLITLTPYDSQDARGLLKAAIRDPNPVMFLQNEYLYGQSFILKEQYLDKDFVLPIGKAKIMRPGTDVTLVAYNRMVGFCLQAATFLEDEGYSCEVINLRSIRPLDRQTIVNSVKKTGRIISVEDGWPQCGVGAQICALMLESSAFSYLQAPPSRICGADIPMPYSKVLEDKAIPSIDQIISKIKQICDYD